MKKQRTNYIYAIRNSVNQKIYIGRTNDDIKERYSIHVADLRNGKDHCVDLQKDLDLLGEDKFRLEVVEDVSESNVAEIERYWIMKYYADGRSYNSRVPIEGWKTDLYRGWVERVTGIFGLEKS